MAPGRLRPVGRCGHCGTGGKGCSLAAAERCGSDAPGSIGTAGCREVPAASIKLIFWENPWRQAWAGSGAEKCMGTAVCGGTVGKALEVLSVKDVGLAGVPSWLRCCWTRAGGAQGWGKAHPGPVPPPCPPGSPCHHWAQGARVWHLLWVCWVLPCEGWAGKGLHFCMTGTAARAEPGGAPDVKPKGRTPSPKGLDLPKGESLPGVTRVPWLPPARSGSCLLLAERQRQETSLET